MKKNTQHSQHSTRFHERPLVTAVRHALPYVVGLSLALSISQPASGRSSDSAVAFTATQLVRQFTLKNTVTQVSLGMQGYVAEVDGQQRGPAMGARPTGFPADMGSVPATVNLPQRDGAGRPLGYCAWDNNSATTTASYNAGQGVANPLVYAIVSPGLNGAMQTTCANILASGVGLGDDHVQVTAPMQVSSRQYRTSVGNFTNLQATPGEEGDIRLVLDTNMLYSYVSGAWEPVQSGSFQDDGTGTGAISYTGGTVTVADFLATTATMTGAVSADSATFTNGVVASTFTGNGAGLTDLNAANISAGVLAPEFGGTGVNGAAAANGTLLIGNGSGFTLGTLTAGAGISVLNDAGVITLGNNGVLSIAGTADQIIASANNGDVVLSLPQAIATTSTPTFGGMVLNGDLIGTTGTFTGAVSALSFAGDGSALTNLNASSFTSGTLPVATGGTGVDGSAAANGTLLIGNGTGYTLGTLTAGAGIGVVNGAGSITLSNTGVTSLAGTADQVNVSAATGAVTLSLPQNISNTSDVLFGTLKVRRNVPITGQGAHLVWNRIGGTGRTFLINHRGIGPGGISFGEATSADVYTENMVLTRFGDLTVSGSITANDGIESTTGTFSAAVTALSFAGDGSALTNLNAGNFTSGTVPVGRGGTGVDGSAAANGQLLIGNGTGYALGTLTAGTGMGVVNGAGSITLNNTGVTSLAGTANQLNVSAATGAITLSLPQNIGTGSDVEFASLKVREGATITSQGSYLQWNRVGGTGRTYLINNRGIGPGGMSFGEATSADVYDENMFLSATGHLTVSNSITADNGINSTTGNFSAAVTALSFAGDGSALTNLNVSNFSSGTLPVARGGTGVDGSAAANGQLLIGNGTGYALGTLTAGAGIGVVNGAGSITLSNTGVTSLAGTADQVIVSAGTGAVTLSLPQAIATTSTPTFGGMVLNGGLTGTTGAFSGAVTALSFAGDGSALTNLSLSNFSSGTLPVARGGTGVDGSAAANGTLLIGNGTGYTLGTLTAGAGIDIVNGAGSITLSNTGVTSLAGTANQVNVSAATGAVTLSLPQAIATTSTPTFGGMVLNGGLTGTTGAFSGAVSTTRLNIADSSGSVTVPNIIIGTGAVAGAQSGGGGNTAVGINALQANTDGEDNAAFGVNALISNTAGSRNAAFGAYALQSNTTGYNNAAFGDEALGFNTAGYSNAAFGKNALLKNTTGYSNTGLGADAMENNTTGNRNSAVGDKALFSNSGGSKNSALGHSALRANTTGTSNVAVGVDSLDRNTTGYDNVAVGVNSMLMTTTGYENLAIGNDALRNQTTGYGNVGMGKDALSSSGSGFHNTALGKFAGNIFTSGNHNTFVGYNANSTDVALTYASAFGADSMVTTSDTIALGRADTTDQIVIGASSRTGSHKLYVEGTALVTGGVTTTSDSRLKTNIQQMDHDSMLEKLGQISAYRYNYINLPQVGKKVGVLAQELQTLFPEVANYGNGDQFLSVDYSALGAMAAVGVGQLNIKHKALSTKVDEQGTLIADLDKKVSGVDTRVTSLETWKAEAVVRMDGFQTAIDSNVKKIAENALAIQGNTTEINRLDDVLIALDGTVKGNSESINNINARWGNTFSASEDGSLLTVVATELKVSNFTAQQIRSNSVYSLRLEAEMAAIRELEVDNLKTNTAVANSVQAKQVNTGAAQVYAGVGAPAFLFAAPSDGHYTVNTSAMDGSYATATVIVNAGQAKVVPIASEGIELMAVGNSIKANAAGKSIRASWIKTG